jgi:hypothetical protein
MTRTDGHAKLDFLVGTWSTTVVPLQQGGQELNGSIEFQWGIGGVWLEQRGKLVFPGAGQRETLELLTYDSRKQQYVGTWQDNLSTQSTAFTGEWRSEREFVMIAALSTPDGRSIPTTVHYKKISDAELQMEQYIQQPGKDPQLVFKQILRKS